MHVIVSDCAGPHLHIELAILVDLCLGLMRGSRKPQCGRWRAGVWGAELTVSVDSGHAGGWVSPRPLLSALINKVNHESCCYSGLNRNNVSCQNLTESSYENPTDTRQSKK